MLIIGLTGGIGSGKSLISYFLKLKGIPVYNTDTFTKNMMENNNHLKKKIIFLFGRDSYTSIGKLNTNYLSNLLFSNNKYLYKMNILLYPYIIENFKYWFFKKKNNGKYCIKESAILFEQNFYMLCDLIIYVTSYLNKRIDRLLKNGYNKNKIFQIMSNQIFNQDNIKHSNVIIYNNLSISLLKKNVNIIHDYILQLINKNSYTK